MKDNDLAADLYALQVFKDQLRYFLEDLDRAYQPSILRLAARDLPGTDTLSQKLQQLTAILEELLGLIDSVRDAASNL